MQRSRSGSRAWRRRTSSCGGSNAPTGRRRKKPWRVLRLSRATVRRPMLSDGRASPTSSSRAASASPEAPRSGTPGILDVEAEMEDVAVLHGVLLAFQSQLAGIAGAGFAVQRHVVVVGDGLGADETPFEVGVDHTGGFRRLGLAAPRPGARLL